MPATFVLRGVKSPRTEASSVACSARPPSHKFQFAVSVTIRAAARDTTRKGVTNFSHGQRAATTGGSSTECGTGCGAATRSAAFISTLVFLSSRPNRDSVICAVRYNGSLSYRHACPIVVPRLDGFDGLFKRPFENTLADGPQY